MTSPLPPSRFLEDFLVVNHGLNRPSCASDFWWRYADLFEGSTRRLITAADPLLRKALGILVAKHFPDEMLLEDSERIDLELEMGEIGDFLQRYFSLRALFDDPRMGEWFGETRRELHVAVLYAAAECRLTSDGSFDRSLFFELVADIARFLPENAFFEDPVVLEWLPDEASGMAD